MRKTKKLLKELKQQLKQETINDFIQTYSIIISTYPVSLYYKNQKVLQILPSKLLNNYFVLKTNRETYILNLSDIQNLQFRYE